MKTFTSKHRFARMTARKGRYVMDLVRGLPVNDAMHLLDNNPRRAAHFIGKVLRSAIANASQDASVNVNRLRVQRAFVDDGPLLQGRLRWRPGPQGRAMPFRKRTCHITVVVGEDGQPGAEVPVLTEMPVATEAPAAEKPAEKPAEEPAEKKSEKNDAGDGGEE